MKRLLFLITLTSLTTLFLLITGIKSYSTHTEPEKDLIEKSTPINGRIDTEFLERTFGPADEQ